MNRLYLFGIIGILFLIPVNVYAQEEVETNFDWMIVVPWLILLAIAIILGRVVLAAGAKTTGKEAQSKACNTGGTSKGKGTASGRVANHVCNITDVQKDKALTDALADAKRKADKVCETGAAECDPKSHKCKSVRTSYKELGDDITKDVDNQGNGTCEYEIKIETTFTCSCQA